MTEKKGRRRKTSLTSVGGRRDQLQPVYVRPSLLSVQSIIGGYLDSDILYGSGKRSSKSTKGTLVTDSISTLLVYLVPSL